MNKILIIILIFTFGINSYSQIIDFPDVNLKNVLLSANTTNFIASNTNLYFSPSVIDLNGDGEIDQNEALLIERLNISNSSITNLEGIQYFTNLKRIDCNQNNISEFNFSEIASLKQISISNNLFQSLVPENLPPDLSHLNCSFNGLSHLDMSSFNSLRYLNCSNNQIDILNFSSNNINMYYLNCSFNNLTSINITNFDEFEDEGEQTIYLNCSNNQLSEIIFPSGHKDFSFFDVSNNNLTEIDLNQIHVYGSVNFSNNPFNNLDFTNFGMSSMDSDSYEIMFIQNTNVETLIFPSSIMGELIIKNNQNLNFVSLKNEEYNMFSIWVGYDEELEESIYETIGLDFTNNPNLSVICCDSFEIDYINSITENITITDNCSLNTTSIQENINLVNVFPNPFTDLISIKTSSNDIDIISIKIYNMLGQLMMCEIYSDIINTSHLNEGNYVVFITTNQGNQIQKLIKK
jgi:hypothetical protein